MNYLYLLLNLGSISIPFIFSFHPKLKFYKLWKPFIISVLAGMVVFIPWDIAFTINGFWGFNNNYLLGINLFNLPIEEWLFFICIPYACVFTHYALLYYFPKMELSTKTTKMLSYIFIIGFTVMALYNYNRWYTFINFSIAAILLLIVLNKSLDLLKGFYLTFLVILIPFFLVNGLLTGSTIKNEVVWYNNTENLGIRLFTIPIEDVFYAFSLILLCLFIMKLKERSALQASH
ncbi:lycopene cyclase domain-containing protein [Aestuariivivens marinum]|uniref:lycopene cyclase domain-containing protein n=1 Tax=Aestuariivivens marinum TaxID=2913555 RepID=UPI001F5A7C06|nr:lycopene cyclase domain-containing protein [Aestuariivivens marinum]